MAIQCARNRLDLILRGCFRSFIYSLRMVGLCGIFSSVFALASVSPNDFEFRALDMQQRGEAGIGPVTSIVEDRHGFMWFGGESGLVRFDGERYRYFYADVTDPNAIGRHRINDLKVDKTGNLWVATSEGISLFDEELDTFVPYGTENSSFTSSVSWELSVDVYNNIYIASASGLYVLGADRETVESVWSDEQVQEELQETSVRTVYVDSKQRLWIGGENQGLTLYNLGTKQFRYWGTASAHGKALGSDHINSVYEDSFGHIWVMTHGGGASWISADLESVKNYLHDETNPKSISRNDVWDAAEDTEGNIWFSTGHGGISIYQYKTGSFTQLTHQYGSAWSIPSNQVKTLYVDKRNDIWVGFFPSGVAFFNSEKSAIHKYVHNSTDSGTISDNGILGIIEDSHGNIWVGTERGLNVLDRSTGEFKQYFADKSNLSALSSSTILSLVEDNEGYIWVGSWGGGLHKFNPETETFTRYYSKVGSQFGFSAAYVWTSLLDSSGTLWFGSEKNGMARYDKETESFVNFRANTSDPEALSHNLTWKIIEESPGKLLVATGVGLDRFDIATQTFSRLDKENNILGNHYFRTLLKLNNGEVWIGTEDAGIFVIDSNGEYIERKKINSQLPNLSVVSMVQDLRGLVWATTTSGVAVIDPLKNDVTILNESDGLAGSQYNRDATLVSRTGSVYLGGTSGISVLMGKPEVNYSYKLSPKINEFKLFNKKTEIDVDNSPLKKSILFTDDIQLTHEQSVITFGFSAKNYRYPQKTRYSYKLEGFDEDWNEVGSQATATYTNLDSGSYVFKVKSVWHDGNVQEDIDSVNVLVKPPSWFAWYANVIYFLSGVILIYFFFSFKLLQQKKGESDKSIKEKGDFILSFSKEFGPSLNNILNLIGFALKNQDLDGDTRKQLEWSKVNASEIKAVIDSVIDISDLESKSFSLDINTFKIRHLVRCVVERFQRYASEKRIEFVWRVDDNVPSVLEGDAHRFSQILSCLVSNGLKYTDRGYVRIEVSLEFMDESNDEKHQAVLHVVVSDSGIGMSEESTEQIFDKFKRVEIHRSKEQNGLGLGLTIARQLVDKMEGEISVESHYDRGSIFSFSVPFYLSEGDAGADGDTGAKGRCGEIEDDEVEKYLCSHKLNILVAEDSEESQILIRQHLEDMGHDVVVVEDGLIVLETLAKNEFDLLLMDGRMPVLDGYETSRIIRSGGTNELRVVNGEIEIIALLSRFHEDDRRLFLKAGISNAIHKPIDPKVLQEKLERIIGRLLENEKNLPEVSSR